MVENLSFFGCYRPIQSGLYSTKMYLGHNYAEQEPKHIPRTVEPCSGSPHKVKLYEESLRDLLTEILNSSHSV